MRTQIKVLALAASMGLAAAAVYAGTIDLGFDNKTDIALSMFVDGAFGCYALPNLTCTAKVETGSHLLTAKSGDRIVVSDTQDIEPGSSWWRVYYTPQ